MPDIASLLDRTTPDGLPLVEPVGAWTQAGDPPFAPRTSAFGGTLSNGRVVVWGGSTGEGDDPDDPDKVFVDFGDGGIFDPATGSWQAIPDAPVPAISSGGASITSVQLVDDRLAVATGSADGGVYAAVYDVAEGQWTAAPAQTDIRVIYDAMAWDGDTLALVRTQPGQMGYGDQTDLDWRIDEPTTLRWTPGEASWTTGAPAPFGVRDMVGTAFDGTRLALWGGTSVPFVDDTTDHELLDDGAIYDVAADTWHTLPDGPRGRTHAELMWSNGRLFVGGGLGRGSQDLGQVLPDVSAYDPATQTWGTLPDAPDGGLGGWMRGLDARFVTGEPQVLTARSVSGVGAAGSPGWFYGTERWELAPLSDVEQLGDFTVATAESYGNPGLIQVQVGRDQWLDAAEAPFDNRTAAASVTTGNKLVVIGFVEGADRDLKGNTWVFDLAG